jgi:cysteinyl-tRNA synthetase
MKPRRTLRLTNSLTGKKEEFRPLREGVVSLYSCGPTVYGPIHIGNLRAGLVADLFFRYFSHVGFDVHFARNYTDVDDKIIQKAAQEGVSADEVAKKYTRMVEEDYAHAGMRRPVHACKVTETIPEIIGMIESILARGHAYVIDTGEVLYSIESFEGYGKLSHKKIEDLVAGMRVEVNEKKRNPLDFALWKPAKAGEPAWESPWGPGRPGWHIECSAMIHKHLGEQIDIHHGGEDLLFPHHENEIAQSEGATGKAPFARYWLHHAFITMSKAKMSKSLGNIVSARDFLSRYGGEVARYFCLSSHYRSPIDLSEDSIETALSSLQRLYEAKAKAQKVAAGPSPGPVSAEWAAVIRDCEKTREEIEECYANDLNTAGALGALFTLIRAFNRVSAEPGQLEAANASAAAQAFLGLLEHEIGEVLGVGGLDPAQALLQLEQVKRAQAEASGQTRPSAEEIQALIQARKAARAAKNFAESDRIRDELLARGVAIKDGPQGTTWEYR